VRQTRKAAGPSKKSKRFHDAKAAGLPLVGRGSPAEGAQCSNTQKSQEEMKQ